MFHLCLRQFSASLIMIAAIVGYEVFTWLGLPEKTTAGRYDSLGLLSALVALFLVIFSLPRLVRPMLAFLVWFPLLLIAPLNWWNYGFYQDVMVWSSFLYGEDVLQGARAIGELGYLKEALLGGAGLLCLMLAAVSLLPDEGVPPKYAFPAAMLFVGIAVAEWQKFAERDEGVPVTGSAPVMALFRSMVKEPYAIERRYVEAVDRIRPELAANRSDDRFPLYQMPVHGSVGVSNPENVILLVLESVRASETGLYAGKPYTPNLDRIAHEAVWVSHFYSNTTQTVRAETAILCGVLDFNRGAPFSKYAKPMRNFCVPEILAKNGYATFWFHGYTREFFDRETYLPAVGFGQIHDKAVIARAHPGVSEIGWGVADESVLLYALGTLKKTTQPFFAEILTLSNHYPFDWEWDTVPDAGLNAIHGEDTIDNYHRGLKYTDHALGVFWDEFKKSELSKNTAVIIVGDHGVWVFDKNEKLPVAVKHEQYYRVPFLAYFPGRPPAKLDRVGSQVDIPPSLLNYLGLLHPSAFLGVDILAEQDPRGLPFAVMIRNGSVAARLGGAYCYPSTTVCSETSSSKDNVCEHKAEPSTDLLCVESEKDLLLTAKSDEYRVVEREVKWLQDLSDYMDSALMLGFVPELASERLREEEKLKSSAASVRSDVLTD